jgi:lipoprotein signal peptidase
VFNVGDSGITVGVIIILIGMLFTAEKTTGDALPTTSDRVISDK